jgi:N utilization substance protein B
MSRRAPRFASRQVALQALYALDLARAGGRGGEPHGAPVLEDVFAAVAENFGLPEGARAFAKELVCGVVERQAELDALIARHARNWRLDRMAAVDRNVLRLASWELLYTDTPASVVIDQAIELARRFGDEPSPAFVNGVLDAVSRSVERPARAPR